MLEFYNILLPVHIKKYTSKWRVEARPLASFMVVSSSVTFHELLMNDNYKSQTYKIDFIDDLFKAHNLSRKSDSAKLYLNKFLVKCSWTAQSVWQAKWLLS
jgi:hypothetical protein